MVSRTQLTKTGPIMSRASVGELLMEMFLECLSRGMKLPFTVCYLGVNGGVSVSRLPDLDGPMEPLFKNSVFLVPPLDVMIVDRLGHSLKAAVTQQDDELRVSAADPGHLRRH